MLYFYIKIEPANRRSFQRIDCEISTVTIALRIVRQSLVRISTGNLL